MTSRRPVTFQRTSAALLLGYKVMRWDPSTHEAVSLADQRLRFRLRNGDVHSMKGVGIFMAADPQWVIDYYAPEDFFALIEYSFNPRDVLTGNLTDREPVISVSRATVRKFMVIDEDRNVLEQSDVPERTDGANNRGRKHERRPWR